MLEATYLPRVMGSRVSSILHCFNMECLSAFFWLHLYSRELMLLLMACRSLAMRALSTLRGLRGAPEVPPLCRETQSLGQQMLERWEQMGHFNFKVYFDFRLLNGFLHIQLIIHVLFWLMKHLLTCQIFDWILILTEYFYVILLPNSVIRIHSLVTRQHLLEIFL